MKRFVDDESREAGADILSFRYDPFGRRIQKSYTTGANPPTTTTTNYLYDGDNGIEEVDPQWKCSCAILSRMGGTPFIFGKARANNIPALHRR